MPSKGFGKMKPLKRAGFFCHALVMLERTRKSKKAVKMLFAEMIILNEELAWLCWLTMMIGGAVSLVIVVGLLVWFFLKNRRPNDESRK
jgi:heme/copper-type cytochrome/quinol oxidase subunit 2